MSVMEAVSLKNNNIAELEKLVESYPWFAAARKELFLKMSAMGEEYRRDALHRTVLYIYPDYSAFREAYVLSSAADVEESLYEEEQVCEVDLSEMSSFSSPMVSADADSPEASPDAESGILGPEPRSEPEPERKRIYVIGGDYFMPDDLRDVQGQDLSSLDSSRKSQVSSDSSEFTDEAFYTETLARIYMFIAISILIIIASLLLTFVVLIQNSKGGGLAANFAAGNQTFGVRQTADFLEKATWTLAIIILALCILATAFTPTRKQGDNAVLQKLEQTSTNTGAPEFPTTIPGGEAAPIEPVADPAATPAEAE